MKNKNKPNPLNDLSEKEIQIRMLQDVRRIKDSVDSIKIIIYIIVALSIIGAFGIFALS